MGNINGLTTVNGGTIVPFEASAVEVLGRNYSSHPTNIVCAYASEGSIKVEVALHKIAGNSFGVEVYRFKSASELQHYWSKAYKLEEIEYKAKYTNMINYLLRAYATVFGNK